MKTINILVLMGILLLPGLKNSKGQTPQNFSCQKVSGISTFSLINLDTPKLIIITTKTNVAAAKSNPHPKKKIKPYVSNKSTFTDKWWYQLAAEIFNTNMNTKYPSRTVSR
jgi:hypothetical protein